MNKIILFLLLITSSLQVFSEENKIKGTQISGSQNLPIELNLLIDFLKISTDTKSSAGLALITSIMNIDDYAQTLTKEDIFFVGKIAIFKTLLKTNETFPKAVIDSSSVKTLKEAITKTHDPFVSWFLNALLHDSEILMDTPSYKEYVIQKNIGDLKKLELKKIHKKVQLLYRWVSTLNPNSPDFQTALKAELRPILIDALNNIEQSFQLLATTSNTPQPAPIKSPTELRFFALREPIAPKKSVKPKEKSVDEILAPITEELETPTLPEALPVPSKEDWLNNEDTPANLKNLPKPTDDANWLEDI